MIERERDKTNLITSKKEILNRYPGLFSRHTFNHEDSFYMENPNYQKLGLFRFMILPAGVVAVSSFKKDSIWDIENDDSKNHFLETINTIVEEQIESGTKNIHDLVQELHYDTEIYFLRILPYEDIHSSNVITSLLDIRYKDLLDSSFSPEI